MATKEIATQENDSMFSDADLASIGTLGDALDLFGGPVEDISNYGNGFEVADKAVLVGVPFFILASRFNESEYADVEGGVFVTLYVVTDTGAKWIINDGSTGIDRQMQDIANRKGMTVAPRSNGPAGLMVKRGLVRSDYANEFGNGTTYYLAI